MQRRNFKQQARPKKNTLVGGAAAIESYLQSGAQLERIFLQNNLSSAATRNIQELAAKFEVPVNKVPAEKLKSFNLDGHEGVIGLKSRIQYQNLQDVISFVVERGESPLFVLLDGITDIRNIGGIARTAWCCGAHAIIIPDKGVGAIQEDAIITSAGALEKIPVCRVKSLPAAIDELHLNGIRIFATEMTATENVYDVDLTIPAAIIMGSEGKGIHPSLYKMCDVTFKIPMKNDFESLNVSIATAMVLYETMKQRMH